MIGILNNWRIDVPERISGRLFNPSDLQNGTPYEASTYNATCKGDVVHIDGVQFVLGHMEKTYRAQYPQAKEHALELWRESSEVTQTYICDLAR